MQYVSLAGAPQQRAFCDSALSCGNTGELSSTSNPRKTANPYKEAPYEP